MPKKKSRRTAVRARPAGLSPLRTGGRALGALQVPFRRFLEAEQEEDEREGEVALPAGDLEARLMESLGWLLIDAGVDPAPDSADSFRAADLHVLFSELVPAVAEHNGLDPQELVDETRVAWTTYLMFLGESGAWRGEPEELADCLDVASGGVGGSASGQASVLDALQAAEVAVPLERRLEDLLSVPVVAAVVAAHDRLAAGVDVGDDPLEGPAAVVREALAPFGDALDADTLWIDWQRSGVVSVVGGRTAVEAADRPEHRFVIATTALRAVVEEALAASASPAGVVGALAVVASSVLDPLTTGGLHEVMARTGDEERLEDALATVARLAELGVLSPVEPWTARPGLASAVHDVVAGYFAADDEDDEDEDDDHEDDGDERGAGAGAVAEAARA